MKKKIQTSTYEILFDDETGVEITRGINGHPDPFILEYPSLLDIGIMGTCPNKCNFCYQGERQQENMSYDDYVELLSQFYPYINQVALGGRGDPNKHPNFPQILLSTRALRVVPNYTTSGRNLTKEEVLHTKRFCGAVAVSMYNQDFTFEAIKKFLDADCKTNVHWIVSADSMDNILKVLRGEDIWEGKIDLKKLNAIIFLLFKPQGRGSSRKDLLTPLSALKEFSDTIQNTDLPFKVGMDSCLVNMISTIRTLNKTESIFLDTCEAGRCSAYISPDLRLKPCSFMDDWKSWYGSLKEKSIKELWDNSDSFNWSRELLRKHPKKCPIFVEENK